MGVNRVRSLTRHELKIWPWFFVDTLAGKKTFEFRRNDRDFRVDDILVLREWDPTDKAYTGNQMTVRIAKVYHSQLDYPDIGIPGLPMGTVILQLTDRLSYKIGQEDDGYPD